MAVAMKNNFVIYLEKLDQALVSGEVNAAAGSLAVFREKIPRLSSLLDLDEMFELFEVNNTIAPYDPSVMEAAVEIFHDILINEDEITFGRATQAIYTSQLTFNKICTFVSYLFDIAVEEILDEFCEIKPAIMGLLHLHLIPASCQTVATDAAPSEFNHRLLNAFIKILILAIRNMWEQKYRQTCHKISHNPGSPSYLGKLMIEALEASLASTFEKKLLTYPLFGNTIQASCAKYFVDMPVHKLEAIMRYDINLFCALPRAAPMIGLFITAWQAQKNQFWEDALVSIRSVWIQRQQVAISPFDTNNMVASGESYQDRIHATHEKDSLINGFYLLKINALGNLIKILRKDPASNPVTFIQKRKLPRLEQIPLCPYLNDHAIYKTFLIRDNIFILSSILQEQQNIQQLESDNELIQGLEQAKQNIVYLLHETRDFLELFLAHCHHTSELVDCLKQYNEFLQKHIKTPDDIRDIEKYADLKPGFVRIA
jgi:hypothetical protein